MACRFSGRATGEQCRGVHMSRDGLLQWQQGDAPGERYAMIHLGGKTGVIKISEKDFQWKVVAEVFVGSAVGANVHGTVEELAQAWLDQVSGKAL